MEWKYNFNFFLIQWKSIQLTYEEMEIPFISKENTTGIIFYCSTLESRFAFKCPMKEHFLLACV